MTEITPGIARLVALLQSAGFDTTDSGDGVTNVELQMECAENTSNVFCKVNKANAFAEADRLQAVLQAQGVNFTDSEYSPFITLQYSPLDGLTVLALYGVDDEEIWGEDPDLPRKRLEYQIRYCDDWIANPPIEKYQDESEPGEAELLLDEAKEVYRSLRDKFAAKLAALGGG